MKQKIILLILVGILLLGACGGEAVSSVETTTVTNTLVASQSPTATLSATATLTPISTIDSSNYPQISPGLPDNMIIFAIDGSSSVPQNCSMANSRYDIPNLFVPLFGQYYDELLTGSSSQSKFSPWIEVVHWPLWKVEEHRPNSYDVPPMPALNIDYNKFNTSKGKGISGAFFDDLFTYFRDLPYFPDPTTKPTKRTLIFFTDGIFEKETGGGGNSKDQTEKILAELETINQTGNKLKFDVHVVLMCPEALGDDYDWWVARQSSYSAWFHLYDKQHNLIDLAGELWNYALKDKFPVEWNGDKQGIYLLANENYTDLNTYSTGISKYMSCKTAETQEKCVNFKFAPEATGFYGAILSSGFMSDMTMEPSVWTDNIYTPLLVSKRGERYLLWDIKVQIYNDCSVEHSWLFNPGISKIDKNTLSLFWWRVASDLHFEVQENIPSPIFFGDKLLDDLPTTALFTVTTENDFIPLGDVAPCYKVVLFVDGNNIEIKPLEVAPDEQGYVSWDLKKALINLHPEIMNSPANHSSTFQVYGQLVTKKDCPIIENGYPVQSPGVEVEVAYVPSLQYVKYFPDAPVANLVGGNDDSQNLQFLLGFKYISAEFYPSTENEFYKPFLYFVNKDSEHICSDKFPIPYEDGDGIKVSPSENQSEIASEKNYVVVVSPDFFDNDDGECKDNEELWFRIVWNNFVSADMVGYPKPISWECPVSNITDMNLCSQYYGE